MKFIDGADIPFHTFLPVLFVLVTSTVFNAALTWNDFQVLSRERHVTGMWTRTLQTVVHR